MYERLIKKSLVFNLKVPLMVIRMLVFIIIYFLKLKNKYIISSFPLFPQAPHPYTSFALFLKSLGLFSLIVITYVPKCINTTC